MSEVKFQSDILKKNIIIQQDDKSIIINKSKRLDFVFEKNGIPTITSLSPKILERFIIELNKNPTHSGRFKSSENAL
jgi:hypothetical protein